MWEEMSATYWGWCSLNAGLTVLGIKLHCYRKHQTNQSMRVILLFTVPVWHSNTCMEIKISNVHAICHVYLKHKIWSRIIQSFFIHNHPTCTFNPQTWNKLNFKHLRISVKIIDSCMHISCFHLDKSRIQPYFRQAKPSERNGRKFTAKLDKKDTGVCWITGRYSQRDCGFNEGSHYRQHLKKEWWGHW